MKIKRNATDSYFSDIIRMRANWCCEWCKKDFSDDRQKLHCSHFIGRGNKAVRWDLENASALCGGMAPWGLFGCHKIMSEDPSLHYEFFLNRLGKEKLERLIARSRMTMKEQGIDEKMIRLGLKLQLNKLVQEQKSQILGAR